MAKKAMKKKAKPVEAPTGDGKLSKGHLRKLNALRKSLGESIADRAFKEWIATESNGVSPAADKHAAAICDALQADVVAGKIKIPRGGFLIRRGRGRVIVELPAAD